jgi:hypothetical protein
VRNTALFLEDRGDGRDVMTTSDTTKWAPRDERFSRLHTLVGVTRTAELRSLRQAVSHNTEIIMQKEGLVIIMQKEQSIIIMQKEGLVIIMQKEQSIIIIHGNILQSCRHRSTSGSRITGPRNRSRS